MQVKTISSYTQLPSPNTAFVQDKQEKSSHRYPHRPITETRIWRLVREQGNIAHEHSLTFRERAHYTTIRIYECRNTCIGGPHDKSPRLHCPQASHSKHLVEIVGIPLENRIRGLRKKYLCARVSRTPDNARTHHFRTENRGKCSQPIPNHRYLLSPIYSPCTLICIDHQSLPHKT